MTSRVDGISRRRMRKGTKHSLETRRKLSEKAKEQMRDPEMRKKISEGLKGHTPWNKNLKGIHLSPESEFKKGDTAKEANTNWKGGIQTMKKDCVHLWDGTNKRVRRPKKIYEEQHGKLPKGHVIYHIDGDKHNDSPDNLEAITRAELIKRNNPKLK